ncbi:MAG: PAS domain S-box protein [Polyangiales bacterium]
MIGDEALRAVFDASSLGITVLGTDGRLRCANRSLQRMLGYTELELQRSSVAELTHPGDAAAEVALFEELVTGQRAEYELRKRCIRKDGSAVRVRQTVSRQPGSSEQPIIIAMIEDLTAAHGTEEKLRNLVHTLGERVKELTALHRTAELLLQTRGTREEQLRAVAMLLPPAMQYPEITTGRVSYGDETYATPGHAVTPWVLSASFQAADGKAGVVEVAYHVSRPSEAVGPFLTEEVALLSSLAEMIRAAIDRQSAEQTLHSTNEHLNLALQAAGMGIWEWDVVRNTVRWSPQLSLMLGLEGVVEGPFGGRNDVVHPDDRDPLFQRLELAAKGADDLRGLSFRMRRHDGVWRDMEASAVIVREPGCRATRIIVALIDVTDRRALQNRLRRRTY